MTVETAPTQFSGPKLSESATHLCIPDGIATTGWPAVAKQLQAMEWPLDRWQEGIAQVALGKRADGQYAAGVGGVVMSLPRQVGKTHMVGGIVFGMAASQPGLLVIWTAHHSRTFSETFEGMALLTQNKAIAPLIANVRRANGEQGITFTNGSRILFGAREHGFGRGIPEVDVLVLDEAQILTEKALDAMMPALNASPNALYFMMGTPPLPGDPSEAFARRRQDAIDGTDTDTLFVQMSADDNADLDDRRQWLKANLAYACNRVPDSALKRLRRTLSPSSFRREALGIWDASTGGRAAFRPGVWADAVAEPPKDGTRVFGVRFTADGSHVALAGAIRSDDGRVHAEAIRQAPVGDGTHWLIDFLVSRRDSTASIVIDGRSGAGFLVNALRAEGIGRRTIITPTAEQAITAHAMIDQALTDGSFTHSGQKELDYQESIAIRRQIGKAGGWGIASQAEGETVALLEAVIFAQWGARTTKRKPGRKQVVSL